MKNLNSVRAIGDIGLLMLGIVLLFAPENARAIAGFVIILSATRLLGQWIEDKRAGISN